MIGMEIKGLSNILNYIEKLEKQKLANFKKAGIIAVRDIQLHFRNSEGQNGNWKAVLRGGKPLQKTGALQQSITEAIHGDDTIEVGTNIKYAKIQNFGGIIKPVNKKYLAFQIGGNWYRKKQVEIPQREFMWLSEDADNKITAVLTDSWESLK